MVHTLRSGWKFTYAGGLGVFVIIISLSRIRPHGLFRFRIYFSETFESIGQVIGLLGRGIGPTHGLSIYIQDNTTQKNAGTHPCLEWDSKPRS
jgi:hypothetical protein